MVFSLFYHSTIIKENKLFYSLLYGSVLYLVIHAIMSFADSPTIDIIKNNYFWTLFYLDLGSFLYFSYNDNTPSKTRDNSKNTSGENENDIKVTINTLKNKINNILTPEGSLHLSTQEPVASFPINSNQNLNNNSNNNSINNDEISFNDTTITKNLNSNVNEKSHTNTYEQINSDDKIDNSKFSMSTPIKKLHQQIKPSVINDTNQQLSSLPSPQMSSSQKNNDSQSSTKITDLRDRLAEQTSAMKPEGFSRIGGNDSDNNSDNNSNQQNRSISNLDVQSVAGSDVGSILDLDLNDFENSIH
jgi:hypothetical protein